MSTASPLNVEWSKIVKIYYGQLVGRWKEEIDTLLVYAGLSSAVLTAFVVQSYQLLQPDPADMTLAALKQISSQLNSFTVTPPFVNATDHASQHDLAAAPFRAPQYAVWLNVLWFSSLVFSLASATVALFVKQWLYEATVGDAFRESARLRQYRLNGLLKWRVGRIVVGLPIMLQLASVLFLVGILEDRLSIPLSTSLAIYALLRTTRNTTMRILWRVCQVIYNVYATVVCGVPQLVPLHGFAYGRGHLDMPTWLGRDQNAINEQIGTLDRTMVTTAYAATTDTKFLSYMPMIFPDLPIEEIVKCFKDLSDFQDAEFGQGGLDWGMVKDPAGLPMMVMYALRHMLTRTDKGTHQWEWDCYEIARHFYTPVVITQPYAEITCRTLCQLAVEDPSYDLFSAQLYNFLIKAFGGRAHHTYDTLCHVRAMVEQALTSWNPSDGWPGYMQYMKAVHCLLHYIDETASGRSELSPSQEQVLLTWGREALFRLRQWLRDLEWYGLHAKCIRSKTSLADSVYAATFPHCASHYFVKGVVDPLIALRSTAYGRELVSQELASAVESAWMSARVAYPNAIDHILVFLSA
ncbi:hypothetical protein C8T65DRAFT_737132 [Cerioporus squamosus]|nr:hypothetical protein C8T65DRAFT_737132 [Cerioporus squamosus]